ncbi:YciI family protein [Kitasatospora purpeofusca]|uniref:YciI family protein n=1 Tax=Kitasatospora purpeofusca TaxID=67352 RepID=UPI0035DD7004
MSATRTGRTAPTRNTTAKYLLIKHCRGAPAAVDDVPKPEGSGEYVDGQALAPEGTWLRYDGEARPPVTDGPFAETEDLIAGWLVIDVDSYENTVEPAGDLTAAPWASGRPGLSGVCRCPRSYLQMGGFRDDWTV